MRTAGLEPVISHYPRSWRGWRRCHILPEEQGPSKRMAAKRTRHGVLDATEWDDPAGLNSHEELQGGLSRKSYRAVRIRMCPGSESRGLEVERRIGGRNRFGDPELRFVGP